MAAISAGAYAAAFGKPGQVTRITVVTAWGISAVVHNELDEVFLEACAEAERSCTWRPKRIDSYNPRPIRGEDGDELDEWSKHAYAAAWDLFATPPGVAPPGGVWTPVNGVPPDFARCFTDRGFRWGETFKRKDIPHIEWADGLPTRTTPAAKPPTLEELVMPIYTTATAFRPDDPDRIDIVVHDADDGSLWHTWGHETAVDGGGWERLHPAMLIQAGSLSASWDGDGNRLVVTGVGLDGAIWTLAFVEGRGWGEPQKTHGKVA